MTISMKSAEDDDNDQVNTNEVCLCPSSILLDMKNVALSLLHFKLREAHGLKFQKQSLRKQYLPDL